MGKYYSDTLEEAVRLLYFQPDDKKYPEAISLLEKAVEEGEPDAFYFLSRCYAWEEGGVFEDSKKAKKLLKAGIEKGSDLCVLGADRMSALEGELKAAMKHSLKDSFEAVKQSAIEGAPMAQYAVGLFYFWGDMLMGIQRPEPADFDKYEQENGKEALKWFCLAADQGCIPSIRNAFHSQRKGQNGVNKDIDNALRLMEKWKDCADLAYLYYDVAVEYKNLGKAKDAIRWYEMGIAHGDGDCTSGLALMYLDGDGIKKDEKKGFEILKDASESGVPYVYHNLARCYYFGMGTPEDEAAAFPYFYKAAHLDVESSQYYLGVCYYWGRGVEKDYEKAFEWAMLASKGEVPAATVIIGLCYLYGHGVTQDMEKGRSMLEDYVKSRDNGDAFYALGMVYDKGMGVPENIETAVTYYQKAMDEGIRSAGEDLARFKKNLFGRWKRR